MGNSGFVLARFAAIGAVVLAAMSEGPAAVSGSLRELPCPSEAGWQLVRELELPRQGLEGEPIGGFSAVFRQAGMDRLWLLSDLPEGSVSIWSGLEPALAGDAPLRLQRTLPLRSGPAATLPARIDGEGMVLVEGQLWVASEGRRLRELPAQLLRFEASSGLLLQALELPADWQPGEGRGLASNGGPESLTLMPGTDGAPALLMAAEHPLLQDQPGVVRLLRWGWQPGQNPSIDAPQPQPLGSLLLPAGDGWGLTELLALDSGQVLGLLRRFEAPFNWSIRLALYSLPAAPTAAPSAPLAAWDLIAAGLSPDNWEGLTPGPRLEDGRPTLLLVSDDNLNPLQANRLAQLVPLQPAACPAAGAPQGQQSG
ncbi:MAG: esterase-like activity of phytase family protein [Cyanobacteria bacterium J06638_7]